MANQQNGKRRHAAGHSQDEPPAKRVKPTEGPSSASSFAPAFWDGLSRIWLTARALRELDRRRRYQPPTKPTLPVGADPTDLARFARHGGPDLLHLRTCPEPNVVGTMGPAIPSSSASRMQSSNRSTTSGVFRSKRSSAYTKNFQTHLIDYGVYMDNLKSKPGNIRDIRTEIGRRRASLSLSRFSEDAFESFQRNNHGATFENDVVTTVIPTICGNPDITSKQNVLFTELKALTTKDVVRPKPDSFDGAHLQQISSEVRKDEAIRSAVIPTKHPGVPVAPNFFLEVKGPDGSPAVGQRQVCYVGAYGARAMHCLQNYRQAKPTYDGNANTFSSTYSNGMLILYAHHVTAPTTAGKEPEYHMTQIDAWAMTGNIESFRRGAAAFRNARDLAKRHRDRRGCQRRISDLMAMAADGGDLYQACYQVTSTQDCWCV